MGILHNDESSPELKIKHKVICLSLLNPCTHFLYTAKVQSQHQCLLHVILSCWEMNSSHLLCTGHVMLWHCGLFMKCQETCVSRCETLTAVTMSAPVSPQLILYIPCTCILKEKKKHTFHAKVCEHPDLLAPDSCMHSMCTQHNEFMNTH